MNNQYMNWTFNTQKIVNQTQQYYKIFTAATYKNIYPHQSLSLRARTGLSMVDGEGHTVPERVGPRGEDNAANPVLTCRPSD